MYKWADISGDNSVCKVKVSSFSVSLDGFGAGLEQDFNNPLGIRGLDLHQWIFKTKTFHAMTGTDGGETGVDNDFFAEGLEDTGAWIMGRNMFGPIRSEWPDDKWKGWWGANPPFHGPVFVLTHYPREPLEMEGGTTFHFVTDGIESAMDKARKSAGSKNVKIGGGVSTIRQYLAANLIDEMHVAFSPVILGRGEPLFAGIDLCKLGFRIAEHRNTSEVTHLRLKRS
ncbi:MAG TPA: dihydrofolate reductase family protein [Terriglobales bacterium]|nr:dihydrofolate reductase family protein [Terriglobales bacterium]